MKSRKDANWFRPVFEGFADKPAKRACLDASDTAKNAPAVAQNGAATKRSSKSKGKTSDSANWIDEFSPRSVAELAVHPKKVQELTAWLTKSLDTNGVLLLSGPSGCGKTAAIRAVAKEIGVTIGEWVTPADIEHTREYGNETYTYQEKQADLFMEFLLKASRYPSLLAKSSSRIVLVEDFPNVFFRKPADFVEILQKYKDRGKSPLIFICSESFGDSTNIVWNLFPTDIQEKFKITNLSFNPISVTNMKSALKRITTIMSKTFGTSYEIPNQDTIESIVNSSMGDIRSAINNLHFASLKGDYINSDADTTISLKKVVKKKSRKKEVKSKLNSMGKDENINIMHGVGRVLNPKLKDKTADNPREEYTHSPESIVDQFQTQPVAFAGYVHENYLPHFSDVHHVQNAAHFLSDADCLMSEWKEKDSKIFGLSVAVGGVMVTNKAPVSSWHPIKGSKNAKAVYPLISDMPLLDPNQLLQGKVLAADVKTYYEIIEKFHTNSQDDIDDDTEEIEDMFIE